MERRHSAQLHRRRGNRQHNHLGSDLGQKNNPFPINSYERVLGQLLNAGVSREDIRKLVAVNTGRVLEGRA